MYTVRFKSWSSNFSEMLEDEHYDTMDEALNRATEMYSMEALCLGNNCYQNNGLQSWVENESGQCIHKPNPFYLDDAEFDVLHREGMEEEMKI